MGKRFMNPVFRPYLGGHDIEHPLVFDSSFDEFVVRMNRSWVGRTVDGKPVDVGTMYRHSRRMAYSQCIFFDWGGFDENAVIACRVEPDGKLYVALAEDGYYFEVFWCAGRMFGWRRVYDDVARIHTVMVNQNYVSDIDTVNSYIDAIYPLCYDIARRYPGKWASSMFNALMHFYFGMIAEERKCGTRTGRGIKMQALVAVLLMGWSLDEAMDWSCGKPSEVINAFIQQRGVELPPYKDTCVYTLEQCDAILRDYEKKHPERMPKTGSIYYFRNARV